MRMDRHEMLDMMAEIEARRKELRDLVRLMERVQIGLIAICLLSGLALALMAL